MDESPELDRLVSELNTSLASRPAQAPRLEAWLARLRDEGASDLYLVAGAPPAMRIEGTVRRLQEPALDGDEIEEAVLPALPPHAAEPFRTRGIADASLRRNPGGRFRVNLHARGPSPSRSAWPSSWRAGRSGSRTPARQAPRGTGRPADGPADAIVR